MHELLQVAGMFIVDMTARENEDTCADLINVAKPRPDGQSPAQSMETIARTIARRLGRVQRRERRQGTQTGEGALDSLSGRDLYR